MRITTENAHLYLGKRLDARKRRFHYYPLKVIKIKDKYYVKDGVGVCIPVPEENDKFNAIYFDFIIKEGNK